MRYVAAVSFAATALTVSCHGDRALRSVGSPSAAISDAVHDLGNKGFFFKPPMVPDPSAAFTAGKFNESVSPVVLICVGPGVTGTACTDTHIAEFTTATGPGSETVRLSLTDEHYIVNWHTDQFSLDPTVAYRINVFVGTTLLGFADVELGSNPGELKNVTTDEYVPLLDGRTLPIKFRIEDSALCGPPWTQFCSSETVILADGGTVILDGTGDRVDIPPQPAAGDRVITVTLTLCDGVDVDLPTFGNCLTVTADPPLGDFRFNPTATVSMCSIVTEGVVLPAPPQDELVTMYRQDNGDIFALPRTEDFCVPPIGQAPSSLWQHFARAVGRLLAPRPLHATTVVIDVGEGGSTDYFSDFQLALSAALNANPTDLGTHDPGASVSAAVVVTDVLGARVANATVRFTPTPPTGGAVGAVSGPLCEVVAGETVCTSGSDGTVAVTWTLGTTGGLNQLAAKTIGAGLHANLGGTGPFDSCDPEIVDVDHVRCTGTLTIPVDLTAGVVTFTANATSPVGGTIFRATFTNDQTNSAPGAPDIGSWTQDQSAGTIRVRSAVGDLGNRPVELNQTAGGLGGVDLLGTVAGTPPTTGRWVARWRSLINSNDAFFAPIVLRGPGGIIASLEYRSSNQLTYNSPNNDIGINWTQGTSQLFEIVVDLDADVTSLHVNGAPVAGQQNVPFVQPATMLAGIGAELGGTSAQILAWDDIEIVGSPRTIDGVMSPGEWDGAATTNFTANVPGGTTPATLFVRNDARNLYLAVKFQRSAVDATNLLNFEFDNNNTGTGPENGDDYFTFSFGSDPSTAVFSDAFRSTCGELPAGCVTNDRTDGAGAFRNDGAFTIYELSHPLNSGETGKDFALTAPTTIGMLLQLTVGTAQTRFPAGPFPTYITISITAPASP